jgi:hypothetical protein
MSLTTVFKRRIHLSEPEKQALGEQALFVFDTNVLLSLYRVAPKTRAEAFPLLKQLKGRAWIPHHVGVEFFRNRSQYLNEDATRYDVSKKRVEDAFQELLDEISEAEFDKLGSLLDVEKLRAQLNDIRDKLVDELKGVAEKYTAMKEKDEVLALLDDIFEGCVGEPFASQAELDKLYCDGEERYKRKQPPGYKDGDKLDGEFWQDGLVYKRKFGDLIVWKQLLLAAAKDPKRFSHVVFVTQDQKDDWWDKDGHHIIGPRPELTEEAGRSDITSFHMCTLERLLEQLQKHDASAKLSDESLQDVKEIAETRAPERAESFAELLSPPSDPSLLGFMGYASQRAVEVWLRSEYPDGELIENKGFPDLLVVTTANGEGKSVKGFEVISPRNPGHLRKLVTKNLAAARGRLASLTGLRPQVDKLTFVVVLQPLAVANSPAPQWIAAINRAKDFCSRELAIEVVSGLLDGDIFAPLA